MGAAKMPALRDGDVVVSGLPSVLPVHRSVALGRHLLNGDQRPGFEEAAPDRYLGSTGRHCLSGGTGHYMRRSQTRYRRHHVHVGDTGRQ